MKHVRTRLGYEAVTLPADKEGDEPVTLNREPVRVSNATAEKYREQAEAVGVRLRVTDAEPADGDPDEDDGGAPAPVPPVDLSAGVGVVSGQGDPVTTDDAAGVDAPSTDTNKRKAGR